MIRILLRQSRGRRRRPQPGYPAQTLKAVGIGPESIYRNVASGDSLDRQGWSVLVESVRPGGNITVSRLDRIGRNMVVGLQGIKRPTEQGVGIVALDAGGDVSSPSRDR